MAKRFNPPPNWPAPPAGWQPPADWQPDPAWGPAPQGWQLWVDEPPRGNWFTRHKILTAAAALLVFFGVVGALSGGGDEQPTAATSPRSTTTTSTSSAPSASATTKDTSSTTTTTTTTTKAAPPAKPAGPGIGDKARDGKFSFVVRSVRCGIKSVGDSYLGKKAQGQFCRLALSITNIGDEPQSMFADNQYAFDSKGRRFTADSEAAVYDDSSRLLFEDINPGNTLKGNVYFDIPVGAKLTKVELHDSMFSGGVDVALR